MSNVIQSDKLKELFKGGRQRSYQKNEIILRAGDEPQGVYLIESGLVKIYSLTNHEEEHVTHFFGPGDFFPMIWIFRGQLRNVFYETLEPVTVRVVSKQDFLALVHRDREVMLELLEEMVQRYLRYAGRIDNLLYSDARERCAFRLLSLANRFGVKNNGYITINANITHEDMAHSINMTRETFGRSLSRLQKKDIIGYDERRHIIVKNPAALVANIGHDEAAIMWPDLMKSLD